MIIDRKQANLFNLFNLFRLIRILYRLTRALLRLTAYHSPIRVTLLHFTTLKISEKKNKCNRDKTLIAVLKSLSLQSRPPQKRLKSQSAVNSWKLRYVMLVWQAFFWRKQRLYGNSTFVGFPGSLSYKRFECCSFDVIALQLHFHRQPVKHNINTMWQVKTIVTDQ